MNADEIGRRPTPLTEVAERIAGELQTPTMRYGYMCQFSRELEQDRAALMEAVKELLHGKGDVARICFNAERTLAAVLERSK